MLSTGRDSAANDGAGGGTGDQGVVWLATVLTEKYEEVLAAWSATQLGGDAFRQGSVFEEDVRTEASGVLDAIVAGVASGSLEVGGAGFDGARRLLSSMSRARATQGYTPSQTALAVFSLKDAIAASLVEMLADDPSTLVEAIRATNRLVDDLGLITFEAFVAGRQEVIGRQQRELLELSTPVIKVWDGILAVPLIGTLDSERTQVVMESLLERVVATGSETVIIDITGVPTIDTLVAQHLFKAAAATRLMGADCIISGIRPQIAQTLVHLGVDLGGLTTKATLADALRQAMVAQAGRRRAADRT